MLQAPRDGHRLLGFVLHVSRRPQKVERPITATLACEQHDVSPGSRVILIAAAGVAIGSRRGLTFPMNELGADRVVSIAGRRRELPARLIQREGEKIGSSG